MKSVVGLPIALLAATVLAPPAAAQACWNVEDTLTTTPAFRFGVSVALSGDTLLVANESNGTGARVYVRTGGTWVFQQELFPSSPTLTSGDDHVVDLEGDVALLTNSRADPGTPGAAFVFRRTGTTWAEEAKLSPSGVNILGAFFGESAALDGERIAVGSPGKDWVFTFERQGTSWVATQRLNVSTEFGYSSALALDGDTLAVRSWGSSISPQPGDAVLVYVWNGTDWVLEQTLPSPGLEVFFGASVDLDGDRLAVGAPSAVSDDSDAVFLYTRVDGVWSLETSLAPAPGFGRFVSYGADVALDGGRLAVGSPDQVAGLVEPGQVFLYALESGTWSEEAVLTPPPEVPAPDEDASRRFGSSVDLEGSLIVTADPERPTPLHNRGGTAWVFESDPTLAPTVGFRNAGSNPVSFAASEARLGETLDLTVAPSMTGHSQALVFGFDSPITLLLGSGQTLLCLDLGGNGELLNTGFRPGPFAFIQVPVPYDLTLLGAGVCTQAIHAFGVPGFALTNAQDLMIGPPSRACP